MEYIAQKKQGTRNIYYRVITDTAGNITSMDPYDCRINVITDKDGKVLLVLQDRVGNIRHDPYSYLNEALKSVKLSTKRQIATALNLLYTWSDLTKADITKLNNAQVKDLMDFMWGASIKPVGKAPRTIRSPKTVNAYYGFIKEYVRHNDWLFKAFEQRVSYTREATIGEVTVEMRYTKDPNRMKVDQTERFTPPMHLNPKQAKALISVIRESGDKTTFLMVELQMGYGLREGECLGITREDIKKIKKPDGSGYRYVIVLRNRCSDGPDQHCKGLYHPTCVEEYAMKSYTGAIKWVVDITEKLYNDILSYDHDTREKRMKAERRQRLLNDTLADCVEPIKGRRSQQNHYIFVGKNDRRLSAQTYNNHLKKYFSAIGIESDHGKKHTNCSHKLRHTFAMMLTTYGKVKVTREQLRIMLRHRSIRAGEAYFTPTQEETIMMKEGFIQAVHELVGGFNLSE